MMRKFNNFIKKKDGLLSSTEHRCSYKKYKNLTLSTCSLTLRSLLRLKKNLCKTKLTNNKRIKKMKMKRSNKNKMYMIFLKPQFASNETEVLNG